MGKRLLHSKTEQSGRSGRFPQRQSLHIRVWRAVRYWWLRLLRLQGTPGTIARGFAVGAFAGFFPFFGLQTIFGVTLAILFRGNKLAAAAGTWISNPVTDVPIFLFNFKVGQWLLGWDIITVQQLQWSSWKAIAESGKMVSAALLFGCLVMGSIVAIGVYFLSLWAIRRWQKRQSRRRFS
ncbi:MAG: DUF2062 domain-containing protein [Chloroflexaceae bacterium]|nr:DUF2062 domain-containing protein [Chloroflexaceae bacterium]